MMYQPACHVLSRPSVIEACLQHEPGCVNSKDGSSYTILHWAAYQDHLDIITLAMETVCTYHHSCHGNSVSSLSPWKQYNYHHSCHGDSPSPIFSVLDVQSTLNSSLYLPHSTLANILCVCVCALASLSKVAYVWSLHQNNYAPTLKTCALTYTCSISVCTYTIQHTHSYSYYTIPPTLTP